MQTQMNLHVLGGSRGTMENGTRYASVYVLTDGDTDTPAGTVQRFGAHVMKVNCAYEAFDMLQHSHFPGEFECTATLKPGPGGSSKLHLLHMKPTQKPTGKAA